MGKTKITIDTNRCKGCGLCVSVCPRQILVLDDTVLNEKGYSAAKMTDQDKCIACAFCAKMCPDCVITVEKF
ncbi:MAG: 4Fe-4S dicluster domain-containing protein [Eubacteriales bacterium]